MATVCDVVVKRLSDAGVRYIFGVPGDAINSLLEAIRLQDKIKFIHVIHEEAGAFAASAMAKLTGNLAVCVGTAGPGAIHLLNGLYDAKLDHAPVLAITGQVDTKNLGTGYQQEVDLHTLFDPVCTYNQMIVNAEQMPYVITRAIHTALRTRSVCHINIPLDIASKKVPEPDAWPVQMSIPSWPQEDLGSLDAIANLINSHRRIAILAGVGCQGSQDKVLALADKIKAPVIHSLKAKALFSEAHPLSIGGIGNLGISPSVEVMQECDVLILMGTDFPYADYLPRDAKIIQIDISAEQLGKRISIDAGLVGDIGPILDNLMPRIETKTEASFLTKAQSNKADWQQKLQKDVSPTQGSIKPQRLAHLVGEYADSSTIFVCDTGEVTSWTARYLQMKEGQRFTVSGLLASMAFGLPGAIGAKLAFPENRVVAMVGDGGFSMLMADFITAVRYKLPIVFVVFNNQRLGLIQIEQESNGYPNYQTELRNPDFAAYAKLCGGEGLRVTDPALLEGAMQNAFESNWPFVLDVQINTDEIPMPPKITAKQAIKFGIAKVKELAN